MASPTTRGKYKKQALGEGLNTWGLTSGLNGLFDVMDEALHGVNEITLTSTAYALTSTNYTTNDIRFRQFKFTGNFAATITIPATQNWWIIENATGQTLTFDNGSNTATLQTGFFGLLVTNGTTVTCLTLPDGVSAKTVADNIASVNQVATDSASVIAVAGKATEIGRLGTADAVADMALLGTTANVAAQALLGTSANVTAQGHLGTSANVTAQGHLGTSANVAAQALIGTSANVAAQALIGTSANVAAQALIGTSANIAIQALMGTTANIAAQALIGTTANVAAQALIGTTANVDAQALIGTSANITAQALLGTSANVAAQALIGTSANIAAQALIGTTANINAQALIGTSANIAIQALLGTSANVAAMALLGTSSNVTNMANLGTSQNVTNMNTLSGISADITGVNAISANVTAVNTDPLKSNINTTAGAVTNVNAVGTNIASVNNVSTNISSVNSFGNTYQISTNNPTTGGDGSSALADGMLAWVTSADKLRVYNASNSAWEDAGSAVSGLRQIYQYVATANQTVFPATGSISYDQTAGGAAISIFLNGVLLKTTDYTATNGTSVTLASGAALNDEVTIHTFGTFNAANTYSQSETNTLLAAKATNTDLATKAPLASPALTGSPTVNGVAIATGTSDSTLGTLTQAFTAGQQTTINLSANALSPSVAVTKEVPQAGVTNNQWNVDSAGNGNYTRYNTAPATTISFSGTTATLGSGSFSASDVGKTIEVNNGKLVLTNVNGTFAVASTPDNYNQAASGAWQMYALQFNSTNTDLELGHTFSSTYAQSVFSLNTAKDIGSTFSITAPQGLCFNPTGSKVYIMCSSTQRIYEFNLSAAFDVTTMSLVNSFLTSSNFAQGSDFIITPDGTRIFLTQTQGGRIDTYELTTPFDITTCSNFAMVRNMNSTDGESTPTGICFSPDGTNMYVTGTLGNRVYHLSLSTGYDPSSTIAMVSETSIGSIDPTAITMKPDGTRFFIYSDSANAVKIYDTSTAFSFSSASYTGQYTATGSTQGRGLAFNSTGSQLNIVDSVAFSAIYVFDTGALVAPSGYQAAHTTNSIDSTTWTDINSMTASESAGTGTVNYAVSTDDRTTWKIAHNTSGVRNIVKNNSGTWQYNSNATYASETWVNGTTNNELSTLQQAMEGAQSATNAYAVSNFSSTYGTSGNAILSVGTYATAPRDIQISADGLKLFIACANTQTVQEWHMTSAFDTGTASYVRNHSLSGQREPNPDCLFFNADGTRFWVSGAQGWLIEYSVATGFDLSSTVSFVRELNIYSNVNGPTGITFNPTGDKMFLCDGSSRSYGQDRIVEYALTTNFDISTASYTQHFLLSTINYPRGIQFNADGTKMFTADTSANVYEYALSTGFDISTASSTSTTNLSSYHNTLQGFIFNPLGTKIFTVDDQLDRVSQATLGSVSYPNQMNKTQLDAVSDANQFAVSDDLDLAIILNLPSGTGVPSSDGVSINYDANVANQGAILGTDYNYDVPALNKVRITAVNAATLKVRVV